jgi:o-succinylbenzoate synthase
VRVAASPYELRAKSALGTSAATVRHGALLRFEFDEFGPGYADCHPWPELGDAPLAQQLATLGRGGFTRLSERSYAQARVDAQARALGRSVFNELDTDAGIRSHILAGNALDVTPADLERCRSAGFSLVKIKAGRSADREVVRLRELTHVASTHGMKLRVDFNALPTPDDAERLFAAMAVEPRGIDFVEDPTPFDEAIWSQLKARFPIRLALDLAGARSGEMIAECVDVSILKPAIQDVAAVVHAANRPGLDFVVTTYLDHPLGSTGAAWHALRVEQLSGDRLEACGLMTHLNYEATTFSRACRSRGDRWLPPAGTGFGFDSELRGCSWSELS